MRLASKLFVPVMVLGYVVLFCPRDASAYVDPASGSYIIQMLLAGLFAGLVVLKIFWKSVKNYVSNIFMKSHDAETPSQG